MRIAVIGGGPGGLYLAALARALDKDVDITVWERNAPEDTFGFGVVFSDETLGGIEHADPVIYRRMAEHFARWDDIDVHYRGTVTTVGGQGFAAMSRKTLLQLLQERCAELGVQVLFRTEAPGRRHTATRARPGRRRRRCQLRGPHEVRGRLRAVGGGAPQQVHVAGHRPGVRGVQVLHL